MAECTQEERELLDRLYEEEPSLEKEGIDEFDGFYTHWNKVVNACGGGIWDESPLELIYKLKNDKPELVPYCPKCQLVLAPVCNVCYGPVEFVNKNTVKDS